MVNITYLNDIYDHKRIKGYLDKNIKNVVRLWELFDGNRLSSAQHSHLLKQLLQSDKNILI